MRRQRPGLEFINRDRQLPADPRQVGAGVVPGELDGVPLGTPAIDFDVRSTFDVRPINAFDFTFSQRVNGTSLGEEGGSWVFSFDVPPGLVAVVRWYQFWAISPTGNASVNIDSFQGTLLRNGVAFNFNSGVYIGPASERMPVFMLVDENQTFGVRVFNEFVTVPPDGALNIHGNFLVKTGRAYPLEIANPVGVSTATPVLAPTQLYMPPPAPIPQTPVAPEVQRPAAPLPEPEVPPFEVKWIKQTRSSEGSCDAGNGMYWTPVIPTRGGKSQRPLTSEEVRTYERWLRERCPPPDSGGKPPPIKFTISKR